MSKNRGNQLASFSINLLTVLILILSTGFGGVQKAAALGDPRILARANDDLIGGFDWPVGSTITIEIDDPLTAPNPDKTVYATGGTAPWNPNEEWFEIKINDYDFKPGDIVTMSNGTFSKQLTIQYLLITDVDLDSDLVYGTADPGQLLYIQACENSSCAIRDETADQDGNWTANFAIPGEQGWEQDIADLKGGTWLDANINDGDGDMSRFGMSVREIDYFALGDSIASGHGLGDDGTACRRSVRAYPNLVAENLKERFTKVYFPTSVASDDSIVQHFLACSGATSSKTSNNSLKNQVDYVLTHLSSRPTLVSITIGANDFEWASKNYPYQMFYQNDKNFLKWVNNLVEDSQNGIKKSVKDEVNKLLKQSNITVILTEVHNPFNHASFFFTNPTLHGCTFSGSCYSRTVYATQKLNAALKALTDEIGQPTRLQVAYIEESFHGHESPLILCGLNSPLVGDSWIQYPGTYEFNSNPGWTRDLLPYPYGGDCFHPNDKGATAYANAVNEIAILLGR